MRTSLSPNCRKKAMDNFFDQDLGEGPPEEQRHEEV